jgi:CIC family chloride channel protein
VCHAPISTLVMATEMTKGYDLLVPIMLAEVVTFALMRRHTIYSAQPATRRDSPAHGGEYVLDLLQDIRVKDVLQPGPEPLVVPPNTPLPVLLRQASESTQAVFPVVDAAGLVTGVVPLETLRAFFYDEDIGKVAIAADCTMPLVSVCGDDTLATALARFASSHYPQLPVVADGKVLGLLSYEELLQAYSAELLRRRLEGDWSADAPRSKP